MLRARANLRQSFMRTSVDPLCVVLLSTIAHSCSITACVDPRSCLPRRDNQLSVRAHSHKRGSTACVVLLSTIAHSCSITACVDPRSYLRARTHT